MSVIYIKEQGSVLQKKGERLIVTKNSRALLEIPVMNVENIAVIGNVQVTTQAMHMLLECGVDLNYFTFGGKYIGQTASDCSKNIFLRFAQYELYNCIERRMEIARQIVKNKAGNQIEMIRRHRFCDSGYDWRTDTDQMEKLVDNLSVKQTPNEILGIEGMCSNIYFGAFGKMFHCDFEFRGRNRRPPKDPINVLISLGYTFLTKEVSSALDAESFEMYLGFLHGIRYGRKSLPLDIVEEFRQPVIDRFVINLCNKRMINRYDFDEGENGIRLNEDGFKKFCHEYERMMTGAHGINYRNQIKRQVSLLKRCVLGKSVYSPYAMKEEKNVSGEL